MVHLVREHGARFGRSAVGRHGTAEPQPYTFQPIVLMEG